MSKKKRSGNPAEVPVPDREPGIKPASPVEPLIPKHDPEISPAVEPPEPRPGPSEIPRPEKDI